MCLAFPAKVVELKEKGKIAVIEAGKRKIEANNMSENAEIGDYVLVQQGLVVERITKEDFESSFKG